MKGVISSKKCHWIPGHLGPWLKRYHKIFSSLQIYCFQPSMLRVKWLEGGGGVKGKIYGGLQRSELKLLVDRKLVTRRTTSRIEILDYLWKPFYTQFSPLIMYLSGCTQLPTLGEDGASICDQGAECRFQVVSQPHINLQNYSVKTGMTKILTFIKYLLNTLISALINGTI